MPRHFHYLLKKGSTWAPFLGTGTGLNRILFPQFFVMSVCDTANKRAAYLCLIETENTNAPWTGRSLNNVLFAAMD